MMFFRGKFLGRKWSGDLRSAIYEIHRAVNGRLQDSALPRSMVVGATVTDVVDSPDLGFYRSHPFGFKYGCRYVA